MGTLKKSVRYDAVHRKLAETAQHLRAAENDPELRLALLRRMRELLDEAGQINKENVTQELELASNGGLRSASDNRSRISP
jgi:hypothetical protein